MASSLFRFHSLAQAVEAIAARSPSRIALISPPFQRTSSSSPQTWTYGALTQTTNSVAAWLNSYGFHPRDVLISDLPNIQENLILQLACNRLGVAYATVKDRDAIIGLPNVKGAVATATAGKGLLNNTPLPLPTLTGDAVLELIRDCAQGQRKDTPKRLQEDDDELAQGRLDTPHAYYNSTSPFTNRDALIQGADSIKHLDIHESDILCVSISLCHAFGMGSACAAAFQAGATIALPAVGGIRGCGVPSQRAQATWETIRRQGCTLVFADTHTLKEMQAVESEATVAGVGNLRGGVCKIASGTTYLEGTVTLAGVELKTLGKAEKVESVPRRI